MISKGAVPIAPAVQKPVPKTDGGASEQVLAPTSPQSPVVDTPSVAPELQKRFDLFGRWAGGQDLTQNEANNLRRVVSQRSLCDHGNYVRDRNYGATQR